MLCQNCGSNEANVRYTQVINGVKTEMSLCNKCSKELGVDNIGFNIPINFNSFLGEFFNNDVELVPSFETPKQLKCSKCGMTYDEFTEKGKLGCAECYTTFKNKLDFILKKLHGSNIHVGRKLDIDIVGTGLVSAQGENYANNEIGQTQDLSLQNLKEMQQSILDLKAKLKQCIKQENYEEAARIRDVIKKLEEGGSANE